MKRFPVSARLLAVVGIIVVMGIGAVLKLTGGNDAPTPPAATTSAVQTTSTQTTPDAELPPVTAELPQEAITAQAPPPPASTAAQAPVEAEVPTTEDPLVVPTRGEVDWDDTTTIATNARAITYAMIALRNYPEQFRKAMQPLATQSMIDYQLYTNEMSADTIPVIETYQLWDVLLFNDSVTGARKATVTAAAKYKRVPSPISYRYTIEFAADSSLAVAIDSR